MAATDTHSYDGRLNLDALPNLSLMAAFSLEYKRQRGQQLLQHCSHPRLARMVAEMGTAANLDSSHPLNADDLICLAWYHRRNPDFLKELQIQLDDMATGFCPQGRTHRLFQLLMAFV